MIDSVLVGGAFISMRLILFLTLLLLAASAHPCTLSTQGRADCSQSGLTKVPLTLPRNLRYLDLSANSIHHWKPFPTTFSGLVYLNLSGNPLRFLPAGAFRNLSHLRALDLSHCGISRIHSDAFKGLLRLRTLILRDNPLKAINIRNIRGLTRLDVRGTAMMASPRMGLLMDQLAGKRFCDCSSRRQLHGFRDRASGDFCSCAALTEGSDLHVHTASKAGGEVVKRYVRDANAVSNDSLSSNRTDPSLASPVSQGRSWPYLLGFVLIAGTVSLLIAIAAKCKLFHRYFRSYRHRPLTQNEWATESQNELPGVPLPPQDDEDGFIEDNYIQPEDHREELDEDQTQIHHEEL
ncbi:type III endosome membrane protein TEMP [Hyla sarda]|uniref:type III endosome membrane protein TEMP n=1 Tax=Hyla sarda TaxID=327740 RepID=UPI0024C2B47C|nr:type III endosome membrane protein TEMP [Hyla sarda]